MNGFKILLIATLLCSFSFAQEIEHEHSNNLGLVENRGQWAQDVLFYSHSQGNNIWIQQHGFLYDVRDYSKQKAAHGNPKSNQPTENYQGALIGAHFIGSNVVSSITKTGKSSYYYNYFLGNDQAKWTSEAYSYETAELSNYYTDIDLKIIDEKGTFKYEFWCKPGANSSLIQFEINGTKSISIDKTGNLVIQTGIGAIYEKKPIAYELRAGKLREISCSFELNNNRVSFKLGSHSKDATIIIDPVLVFATYSGSASDNFGMTATYGYDGSAYSAGTVFGNSYPTPDGAAFDITTPFTAVYNGVFTTDVYVSKYSSDGSTMLWTAFLGGGTNSQGTETAHSLICDKQNNLYIFGATSSTNFPIQNGYQPVFGGGSNFNVEFNGAYFGSSGTDIYISKISSNGNTLLGSTYMGGSGNDGANYKISSGSYNSLAAYDSLSTNYGDQFRGEIMIDSLGNCLVASCSRSTDFPTLNAFQPNLAGQQDAVIFKLSSDLSSLQWSSYFGGTNNDAGYSVKIDSSYNIVFAGGTTSTDLPGTAGGVFPNYLGGKGDGFVGKLTPNGQSIVQSTYIGAGLYDQAFFVEINRNDEVFVLGQSVGGMFPVINSASYPNSSQFIAKLNPQLTTILNSTVFGNGSSNFNISPSAFLVDICGNMYVSGWGGSVLPGGVPLNGMPISSNAFQSNPPNGFDFYLFVFKRDFSGLLYGTYLGGNQAQEHVDGGTSRFDKNGVVYQSVCGGCGGFSDFPTTPGAWSNLNLNTGNNNCNNIVFKFDFELLPSAEFTTSQLSGCADFEVTFTNTSPASDNYVWDFGDGNTSSTIYSPTITYTTPGNYTVTLIVTDSVCLLTDTAIVNLTVLPSIQLDVSNDTILCTSQSLTFTANSFGTASNFVWSSTSNLSDTLNNSLSDSILTISPTETTTYYVQVSNSACSELDSVTVYFVDGSLEIVGNDSICIGSTTQLTGLISIPGVNFSFDWSPDSILSATANPNVVIASPSTSQWVYLMANGSNGCFDSDSIFITIGNINGNITASANPSVVLPGEVSVLTALPNGYSYSWSPTAGLSSPNSQTTTATVNQTTTYTVTVTDGICTKSAPVTVKALDVVCRDPNLYVPNAFSPNGDGKNDILYVRSAIVTKVLFRVYDRWGELIFESTELSKGWDGTFRGKLVDPDTYDYYVEATCTSGEQTIIKGNTTLIR